MEPTLVTGRRPQNIRTPTNTNGSALICTLVPKFKDTVTARYVCASCRVEGSPVDPPLSRLLSRLSARYIYERLYAGLRAGPLGTTILRSDMVARGSGPPDDPLLRAQLEDRLRSATSSGTAASTADGSHHGVLPTATDVPRGAQSRAACSATADTHTACAGTLTSKAPERYCIYFCNI